MRLDKYLKLCRLIKRRTIAKEVADNERITINGRTAKASSNLIIGDILEIRFGNKMIKVRVTSLIENPKKDDCDFMYELIEEKNVAPILES